MFVIIQVHNTYVWEGGAGVYQLYRQGFKNSIYFIIFFSLLIDKIQKMYVDIEVSLSHLA